MMKNAGYNLASVEFRQMFKVAREAGLDVSSFETFFCWSSEVHDRPGFKHNIATSYHTKLLDFRAHMYQPRRDIPSVKKLLRFNDEPLLLKGLSTSSPT
ncbi:hypothetical protein WG66_014657 [Moniliophthora roreri]|nr:hypothetical protein WG66_014657 [Moniliophthora roreri]